jgi:hypothetical protein
VVAFFSNGGCECIYNGVVNWATGEIVDFAADPNRATPANFDSTLLQGTITPAPLPVLFGSCCLDLAGWLY